MKLLLGLCALLFAGHSMATCTVANVHGRYVTHAEGNFLNAANFVLTGTGDVRGDGTATVQLNYSIAGLPSTLVQNVTYTVNDAADGSGNCQVQVTAPLGGVPVNFLGYSGPAGNKIYLISTLLGTSLHSVVERAD